MPDDARPETQDVLGELREIRACSERISMMLDPMAGMQQQMLAELTYVRDRLDRGITAG